MTEGKGPSVEALEAARAQIKHWQPSNLGGIGPTVEALAWMLDEFAAERSRLRKVSLDFSDWCVDPWSEALEKTATLNVKAERDGPLEFRIEVGSEAFEEAARTIVKESIETFLSFSELWAKLETGGVRLIAPEMKDEVGFLIPWLDKPGEGYAGHAPNFDVTTTKLAGRLIDIVADQYDAWGREAEADVLRSVEPSRWGPEPTENV